MAARNVRGKELALQLEVESQEDWEESIGKEGLTGICRVRVVLFKICFALCETVKLIQSQCN
jgi:hypothetical protein